MFLTDQTIGFSSPVWFWASHHSVGAVFPPLYKVCKKILRENIFLLFLFKRNKYQRQIPFKFFPLFLSKNRKSIFFYCFPPCVFEISSGDEWGCSSADYIFAVLYSTSPHFYRVGALNWIKMAFFLGKATWFFLPVSHSRCKTRRGITKVAPQAAAGGSTSSSEQRPPAPAGAAH